MALGTLAVVGAVNALTALSFVSVGLRLARREVEPADRLAMRAITAWWLCMGGLVALQAIEVFAMVAGHPNLFASSATRFANAFLLALGGWGFCFHILYLRTGNRAW